MPQIPFSFNYADGDYSNYLETIEKENLRIMKLPSLPLPICYDASECEFYPDIENLSKHTPGFKNHNYYGYTLGNVSEFFVFHPWSYQNLELTYCLGKVEISIGQATPMALFIYDAYHDEHTHPEMEDLRTLRIHGVDANQAEHYLLYALIKLRDEFQIQLSPIQINGVDLDFSDGIENKTIPQDLAFRSPISEIEPLRFYYYGISSDEENSFLSFYRVLEYYSLAPYYSEISKLRADSTIGSEEFSKRILNILTKEERSVMCQMMAQLADSQILKEAKKQKLINTEDLNSFSNALYDFRNSIVHAKMDRRVEMYSKSFFQENEKINSWTLICMELAKRAIEVFGHRLA